MVDTWVGRGRSCKGPSAQQWPLIGGALESTESADSNVLARCTTPHELVVHGRILVGDVLVANGEDPGTRLAILGPVLMEEEGDSTLSVCLLPLHRSTALKGGRT